MLEMTISHFRLNKTIVTKNVLSEWQQLQTKVPFESFGAHSTFSRTISKIGSNKSGDEHHHYL